MRDVAPEKIATAAPLYLLERLSANNSMGSHVHMSALCTAECYRGTSKKLRAARPPLQ